MELQHAESLAKTLMIKHNVYQRGWKFEFDRAKRRFGCCKYRTKTITLSTDLTLLNKIEDVQDTILHEIAHALVGPRNGHNAVWKAKAMEIGCKPERCYSSDKVNTPRAKYEAVCHGCNKVHKRHRKPKRISSCGKCSGGRFNLEYKLEFQVSC